MPLALISKVNDKEKLLQSLKAATPDTDVIPDYFKTRMMLDSGKASIWGGTIILFIDGLYSRIYYHWIIVLINESTCYVVIRMLNPSTTMLSMD